MSKFTDFERRYFVPRRDCVVRDFKIRLSFSNDFMVWKVIILQVNPPQVNLLQVNLPQVNSPKCKLPKCKLPKCNLPAGQSSCRSIFPQVNPPAGQFSQVKLPKCNLPKFNPPSAKGECSCPGGQTPWFGQQPRLVPWQAQYREATGNYGPREPWTRHEGWYFLDLDYPLSLTI